ncbi:hypothetical protein KEM60_00456 [Austwickia sp. TVS 96-490-7B]|uniref:hypothetical protein n=1 Tax=Austwickia sp. TVS 96-490-7B TaxID=2830843 RepID=UPI001C587884|nr:hypothetical protein [Austwickia sp. TVS 96-490-7B]MBW3084269.1 hypothetical protein [Austwickia sp. TVS 96-490-7B]
MYKIFGSKYGLFRAALADVITRQASDPAAQDLVLVALLELAPRDEAVRRDALHATTLGVADDPRAVGERLLRRAGIPATTGDLT